MTEDNALKLVPSVIKVICAETFVSSTNSVIRIKKKERECPFFFYLNSKLLPNGYYYL